MEINEEIENNVEENSATGNNLIKSIWMLQKC